MDREERVLVYRLGSLGDTVVALPCFHLIARHFAHAERRVLTNFPVAGKAAPLMSVLEGSGLVHGAFHYPVGLRDPGALLALGAEIRRWRPDLLVYLVAPRGRLAVWRDLAFFRLCGIGRTVGAPLSRELATHKALSDGLWEAEASRLARCLAPLGDAAVDEPGSWDLRLGPAEETAAERALAGWPGKGAFLALGIGTKFPVNDWGESNWQAALAELGRRHGALGLVTLGAAEEITRLRFCFADLTAEDAGVPPYRPGEGDWRFIARGERTQTEIDAELCAVLPRQESFAGLFEALNAALAGDAPWPLTIEDAYQSLELASAIYYASATNQAVDLPLPPAHPVRAGWLAWLP